MDASGYGIAAGINPPAPIGQTIGSILQIAQGVQGFQAGALELQKAQQANTERKAFVSAMQADPSLQPDANGMFNLDTPKNPDGTPKLDPNTGQPMPSGAAKIMRLAPQTGAALIQQLQATNTATTGANQSLFNLKQKDMQTVAEQVQAMNGMSPADRLDALAKIKDQFPGAGPFVDQVSHVYGQINSNPAFMGNDKARDAAYSQADQLFTRRAMGIQEQQAAATPTVMAQPNGQETRYVNIKGGLPGQPIGSEVTAPVTNLLSRSEQSGIITNPLTNQPEPWYKTPYGAFGGAPPGPGALVPAHTGSGGGGSGPAHSGAFNAIPAGETTDTGKQFYAERQASNDAAKNAPTIASNNQQVLNLLKAGTTTGSNAPLAQKVLGSLGIQATNKEGENLASIQHYLNQNLTAQSAAMNVPRTNEGNEVAAAVTGNTTMPTESLKRAVKANDALTSGVQGYNSGLENAIKNYKGPGDPIFASRAFKTAWSQNFDPEVYKYSNAVRDKDAAEQVRIEAQNGKPASGQPATPQWSAFINKIHTLNTLKNTGSLPAAGQ